MQTLFEIIVGLGIFPAWFICPSSQVFGLSCLLKESKDLHKDLSGRLTRSKLHATCTEHWQRGNSLRHDWNVNVKDSSYNRKLIKHSRQNELPLKSTFFIRAVFFHPPLNLSFTKSMNDHQWTGGQHDVEKHL